MRDRLPAIVTHRCSEAAAAAACTAGIVLGRGTLPWPVTVSLAVGGSVLAIDLARRELAQPGPVRPIGWIVGALLLVAVASPANVPNDLRPYAADGRMVAHYHRNPYVVRPSELAPDPAFAHVRDAPAPYGPLFIGATAAASVIAGAGPLPERVLHQAGAALAIGAALVLLWRSRRSTAAIVLVGLHPAVAGTIVNGGHNDAFVGLALLAAVLAAERGRFARAGWIVAAAMLVKFTAGLALAPLAVWAAARGGRRAMGGLLAPAVVIVAPVTLAVPGLFRALRASNFGVVTRTSIWNVYPLRAPLFPRLGDGAVTQLALVAIAAAVVAVSFGRGALVDRVTGAVAAWLVLSAYVMPWYTVWALPVAALDARRPLARVVAWQGAVVTVAFLAPRHLLSNWFVSFPLGWIASIALLAAYVRAVRAGGAPEPVAALRSFRALPGARSLRAS